MKRNGYELQFYGMKGLDPAKAFSTCFVMLPEVDSLHAEFAESLRRTLGRSPAKGPPGISRMRPGQTRLTLTDPNDSAVIFIKYGRGGKERARL